MHTATVEQRAREEVLGPRAEEHRWAVRAVAAGQAVVHRWVAAAVCMVVPQAVAMRVPAEVPEAEEDVVPGRGLIERY